MWDKRYNSSKYAYGEEPNVFFKTMMEEYNLQGSMLFGAEGEGRNAVYAAGKSIEVTAFDISVEGKKKALRLAQAKGVNIRYEVGDFLKMNFSENSFDAAILIYAHFPPHIRSDYHKKIAQLVKPGGYIILEGFSQNHLALREKNPKVGGPNTLEMLFSIEEIQKDFFDFIPVQLEEVEVELKEGLYHNGRGSVVRFVGKK